MKRQSVKSIAILLVLALLSASVTACGTEQTEPEATLSTGGTEASQAESKEAPTESAADPEESRAEITGDFQIKTKVLSGYTVEGSTYTLKKGGSYTLSGRLAGQIAVKASSEETVELILAGVSLEATENAPIYVYTAGKVKLIIADGTYNEIADLRAERPAANEDTEDDTAPVQGNGAIYARTDLSVNGEGALLVTGHYNNGIHSTKDLSYSSATVKVSCVNNALKGNSSVTVKSGNLTLISEKGDGIKTKKSAKNQKLVQKGVVTVEGGTVDIYAACDGIDAAYDALISKGTLNIYTGKYSNTEAQVNSDRALYIIVPVSMYEEDREYYGCFTDDGGKERFMKAEFETMVSAGRNLNYYGLKCTAPEKTVSVTFAILPKGAEPKKENFLGATDAQAVHPVMNAFIFSGETDALLSGDWVMLQKGGNAQKEALEYSCKGIKAANRIEMNGGVVKICASDDGLHAKSDVLLENNEYGAGTVDINGGTLYIVSGDDGIHGDVSVTIRDGAVDVAESYEGIEAGFVTVNGGTVHLTAKDDGINAFGGNAGPGPRGGETSSGTRPCVTVNGGYLEVETASGDTDGIDSNGDYKQTGGYVLIKGGSSQGNMSGSVDVNGTVQVLGGAIVALGGICETPENSCNAFATSGISFTPGKYVLKGSNQTTVMTFELTGNYQNGWFASELLKEGITYTLTKDGEDFLTWTQEKGTMQALRASDSNRPGGPGGPGGPNGPGEPGGPGNR